MTGTSKHCLYQCSSHPALQYAKQEPFLTEVCMTEPETTSLTSQPFQFLSFGEPPLWHFSAPQTYEASPSSIGTIQEVSNDREKDHIKRETTTHEVPSRNFRVLRSADSSRFGRSNSSKSGNKDHISSVLDSHQMRSVSHMTLDELLEIDPSNRTKEMKNQIRCHRSESFQTLWGRYL